MDNSTNCLTLGVLNFTPHYIITWDEEQSQFQVTGTMVKILDIIGHYLGFCYRLILSDDKSPGAKLPNGSWTGLVKLVLEKKIEFTGVQLGITTERAKVVDATEYLYMEEWSAGYKMPVVESDLAGFVKPFTVGSWICIFIATLVVLLTSFMIRLLAKEIVVFDEVNTEENSNNGMKYDKEQNIQYRGSSSPFYDSAVWTFSSLLSQAVPKNPRGESLKLLSGLWLLMTLILSIVYRSNLKAMLILPRVYAPFNSLEELADSGIPVWTPTNALLHQTAKYSPANSTMGVINKRLMGVNGPTHIPTAIKYMNKGQLAMAAPLSSMTSMMNNDFSRLGRCLSYLMKENYLKTISMCLLLPKGSPWKGRLDPVIIRLREAGILNFLYQQKISNSTECLKPVSSQAGSTLRPLDLGDFYGVFLLYGTGLVILFIVFSLELLIGKHSEKFTDGNTPADSDNCNVD